MKFSLSLLDTDKEVRMNILEQMSAYLDKALSKTIDYIEPKIKNIVKDAVQSEPEYSSLLSGELRKEFGIEDTSNVDKVIDNVIASLSITKKNIKIINNGLSGGILLTIVPNDLSGIIDDPSAYVVDSDRGYSLPWLEWLLLKGGDIIVRGYDVKYGTNPRSRSGEAVMVTSNKNWKVPAQFSGTVRNNWITRALSTTEEKILQIIRTGLENNL